MNKVFVSSTNNQDAHLIKVHERIAIQEEELPGHRNHTNECKLQYYDGDRHGVIELLSVGKELVDLGASVTLLPLSMMRRIGGLQLKPIRMYLQLVKRSVKYPKGVVEDVFVRVGRPFMRTTKMVIDLENDKLKIDLLDEICSEQPQLGGSLEITIWNKEDKKVKELIKTIDLAEEVLPLQTNLEDVKGGDNSQTQKLKLKVLPLHLKYVFLEETPKNQSPSTMLY
ncbi:hypothetical protein Lal_00037530 [Lupinus albus]|nr:hypothetical protein Lal_00037530 [Lupinus albus]